MTVFAKLRKAERQIDEVLATTEQAGTELASGETAWSTLRNARRALLDARAELGDLVVQLKASGVK